MKEKCYETFLSKTTQDTINLGLRLANYLKGGDVVLLKGGMGSGKTTFMRGVGLFFKVREPIQSPTFIIIKPYNISKNNVFFKDHKLIHVDSYRLKKKSDFYDLGFNEIVNDKKNIIFIENPSNLMANIKAKYIVYFNINKNNNRIIKIFDKS